MWCLIVSIFAAMFSFSIYGSQQNALAAKEEGFDKKILCDATINDDYDDESIIIVLDKKISHVIHAGRDGRVY